MRKHSFPVFRKAPYGLPCFQINAIVILPDHLHTIWTLPNDDDNYPQRWRSIKSQFIRAIKAKGCQIKKNKRGEHYVWQKRYWEHTIRDHYG